LFTLFSSVGEHLIAPKGPQYIHGWMDRNSKVESYHNGSTELKREDLYLGMQVQNILDHRVVAPKT
jgi:hypothetical protein